MAKSLTQIQSQIDKLQKEADAIRSAVVARIRKEMAQHGLTPEDLLTNARSTFIGNGGRFKTKATSAKPPKYRDGTGNTWGGVGKRPNWIRKALEAGRSLEEFLIDAAPKSAKAAMTSRKKAVSAKSSSPARHAPKPKAQRAAATKKTASKRRAPKKAATTAGATPGAA